VGWLVEDDTTTDRPSATGNMPASLEVRQQRNRTGISHSAQLAEKGIFLAKNKQNRFLEH
jgi:hypothetical protein